MFEIDNSAGDEDNFLWIIVGDLPSMYLDTYGPTSIRDALANYTALADDWIGHIKAGKSIADCYPFNAEPTLELAELLQRRTTFIKNSILKHIDDISFNGQLKK